MQFRAALRETLSRERWWSMRVRSFFLVVLCLASLLATDVSASTGTIDSGDASFRACYLTPENPSLCNYAILYKGLQVSIVGGSASTRYKVQVPMGDGKVVVADGWSGRPDPEGTGWVSPRFVQVAAASMTDAVVAPTGNSGVVEMNPALVTGRPNTVNNESSWWNPSAANMTLPNGMDFLGVTTPGNTAVDAASGSGTGNGTQPGTAGTGVYWVFAGMGEDQEYFFSIAQNSPQAGGANYVWRNIRRDIAESGARCLGVCVVKVISPNDIFNVLRKGMVPSQGLTAVPAEGRRVPIHAVADLVPSNHRMIGFATVSHSGSDGPLVDYGADKGKQFNAEYLALDYLQWRQAGGRVTESIVARLVDNPRFSFCGCNIGHCQYYDGVTPSFGHYVAAIYCSKATVVRAMYTVGSPNAPDQNFAVFGRSAQRHVTRVSPAKQEYRMLVNVPTNRYDRFGVPFSSEEEKNAIIAYYRERDINTTVQGNQVFVRAPTWLRGTWMTRDTDKDNVIESLLQAMATRQMPPGTNGSNFETWLRSSNPADVQRARQMMPRLQALIDDPMMQAYVEIVKRENGGRLDIHDFRLWKHVYFGNMTQEQLRENRWNLPQRACTCNDRELTEAFQQTN